MTSSSLEVAWVWSSRFKAYRVQTSNKTHRRPDTIHKLVPNIKNSCEPFSINSPALNAWKKNVYTSIAFRQVPGKYKPVASLLHACTYKTRYFWIPYYVKNTLDSK